MRACPLFLKDFYSFPSTGCSTFFFQSSQFFLVCSLAHCRHLSVDSENYFVIFHGKNEFFVCLAVQVCTALLDSFNFVVVQVFLNAFPEWKVQETFLRCLCVVFIILFLPPQSHLLLFFYKNEKTVSDNFHDTITSEFISQFRLYMNLKTCLCNINLNLMKYFLNFFSWLCINQNSLLILCVFFFCIFDKSVGVVISFIFLRGMEYRQINTSIA